MEKLFSILLKYKVILIGVFTFLFTDNKSLLVLNTASSVFGNLDLLCTLTFQHQGAKTGGG